MAIQFGPKLPKGNSVQRQPLPKPNTPINNESKPDTPTTQERKGSFDEVKNGQPGDYTIAGDVLLDQDGENHFSYTICYKDINGNIRFEYTRDKEKIDKIKDCDLYFGTETKKNV